MLFFFFYLHKTRLFWRHVSKFSLNLTSFFFSRAKFYFFFCWDIYSTQSRPFFSNVGWVVDYCQNIRSCVLYCKGIFFYDRKCVHAKKKLSHSPENHVKILTPISDHSVHQIFYLIHKSFGIRMIEPTHFAIASIEFRNFFSHSLYKFFTSFFSNIYNWLFHWFVFFFFGLFFHRRA